MARRMQRVALAVPSLPVDAVEAAFVGPSDAARQQHRKAGTKAPVVLLHGFNNSSLEWRRLYPLLEKSTETWAIDLVRQFFRGSQTPCRDSLVGTLNAALAALVTSR